MANKKPILLYQEGQQDQNHDVVQSTDVIDAQYLAVDKAAGNAIRVVDVPGEGKALRVDATRETTDTLFPKRNVLPYVDTKLLSIGSTEDGHVGRQRAPLPQPAQWQKSVVGDEKVYVPVYSAQQEDKAVFPDGELISLSSIMDKLKTGPFYGGRADINVVYLDKTKFIDASVQFVGHNTQQVGGFSGPVPVSQLRDLARLTRTFVRYVLLSGAAGQLALYWAPSKYIYTSGNNGFYAPGDKGQYDSWYKVPTSVNFNHGGLNSEAGLYFVTPEEDEILCFRYPFRMSSSAESMDALLLEVLP